MPKQRFTTEEIIHKVSIRSSPSGLSDRSFGQLTG